MGRFSPVVFSVVMLAAACCAVVTGTALPAGASEPAAGVWGPAQAVPALGIGSSIDSLSCGAAGNCAAVGGGYVDSSGHGQAFVVNETDGSWGTAQGVPGLAFLTAVSCGSAGNCAAVGSAGGPALVVNEVNGSWGKAQEVPGLAALTTGSGFLYSVSCPSAGNCAAGGMYSGSSGLRPFVVDETSGSWGNAQEIAGTAAVNAGPDAVVDWVTCPSAGNCVATGWVGDEYATSLHTVNKEFVAEETDGSWGKAEPPVVDGSALEGLSCWSAGNCLAYVSGSSQAGLVYETNGTWGTVQAVPGFPAGGGVAVTSMSCGSAGNCAIGGSYSDSSGGYIFVEAETGGSWGTPLPLPGDGGFVAVNSVSCGAAGTCAASGIYTLPSSAVPAPMETFVVAESGGSWGTPQNISSTDSTQGISVSCPPAGNCAAAGYLGTSPSGIQAFVADEDLPVTSTTLSLSAARLTYGNEQTEQMSVAVSAPPGATPTGTVTVMAGTAVICSGIPLAAGQASCTLAATGLPAGTWQLTAYYSGNGALVSSASAAQTLTVTKVASTTTLALSAGKVTYGKEQVERVSVAVAAASGGTPPGTVSVRAGTTVVCGNLTLAAGQAACTLPATRLPAGPWQLTASYSGSAGLAASTSAAQTLTVARAASKVMLSLSAARVTYGQERSERLTVKVTGQYAGVPGGKVTVKSGKVTVCTITLVAGKGSCVLAARQLPVGTRTLVAVYSGSSDFTGAASAVRTLKVVT